MSKERSQFSMWRLDSPLGELLVVWDTQERLIAVDFATHLGRMQRLLRLHHGVDLAGLEQAEAPRSLAARFSAFFAGELTALDDIVVDPGGTEFERAVWAALRRIPVGTTSSYGALAATLGRPSASRAVGRANGANPIAIVVPCHRVIGADGGLTGYAGGIERKRWLIEHERR